MVSRFGSFAAACCLVGLLAACGAEEPVSAPEDVATETSAALANRECTSATSVETTNICTYFEMLASRATRACQDRGYSEAVVTKYEGYCAWAGYKRAVYRCCR